MTDLAKRDELADMPPIPEGYMAIDMRKAHVRLNTKLSTHSDGYHIDVEIGSDHWRLLDKDFIRTLCSSHLDVLVLVRERK